MSANCRRLSGALSRGGHFLQGRRTLIFRAQRLPTRSLLGGLANQFSLQFRRSSKKFFFPDPGEATKFVPQPLFANFTASKELSSALISRNKFRCVGPAVSW